MKHDLPQLFASPAGPSPTELANICQRADDPAHKLQAWEVAHARLTEDKDWYQAGRLAEHMQGYWQQPGRQPHEQAAPADMADGFFDLAASCYMAATRARDQVTRSLARHRLWQLGLVARRPENSVDGSKNQLLSGPHDTKPHVR